VPDLLQKALGLSSEVLDVERDELRAPEGARETQQHERAIAQALQRIELDRIGPKFRVSTLVVRVTRRIIVAPTSSLGINATAADPSQSLLGRVAEANRDV